MSQRAVATDPFVPFDPTQAAAAKSAPVPTGLKVLPKAEATPAFAPLQAGAGAAPHVHGAAGGGGKPVVTLQREGDRVTSIRIDCACGQVIELACSY